MMQLAIQMAHHKIHPSDSPCSVYESCSTAIFKHGRTEAIRPVTSETREFCQALAEKAAEKSHLFGLLKKCSSVHSQLTQSAAKGQGWDRHLFALKNVHLTEYGDSKPLPDVFMDEAYQNINQNKISTS